MPTSYSSGFPSKGRVHPLTSSRSATPKTSIVSSCLPPPYRRVSTSPLTKTEVFSGTNVDPPVTTHAGLSGQGYSGCVPRICRQMGTRQVFHHPPSTVVPPVSGRDSLPSEVRDVTVCVSSGLGPSGDDFTKRRHCPPRGRRTRVTDFSSSLVVFSPLSPSLCTRIPLFLVGTSTRRRSPKGNTSPPFRGPCRVSRLGPTTPAVCRVPPP